MHNPLLDDRFVDFLLDAVHPVAETLALPAFVEHDRETCGLYLDAARRLAREVLCRLAPDGPGAAGLRAGPRAAAPGDEAPLPPDLRARRHHRHPRRRRRRPPPAAAGRDARDELPDGRQPLGGRPRAPHRRRRPPASRASTCSGARSCAAAACAYLTALSIHAVAWQWLLIATACARAPSPGAFHHARRRAAQAWFAVEVPRVAPLLDLCASGDDSHLACDPAWF